VILAGFFARWRPFAAAIVAVVALASTVMLALQDIDPLLLVPGVMSLGVSVWLAASMVRHPEPVEGSLSRDSTAG